MSKKKETKILLAEHIFELRHIASGTFLDVRGLIADYIKESGLFAHWKIDTNIIHFRDAAENILKDGGFAGYKSAGYIVYNPDTYNYFIDKATKFWSTLQKNDKYKIPNPIRFGTRTKVFIPSNLSFEQINNRIYTTVFSDKMQKLINGSETDLQFVIDLIDHNFNLKILGGPVHKNEAINYLSFHSDHFKKTGLYLDIDCFKTSDLTHKCIPDLLREGVKVTWEKVENIAAGLGM